MVSELKSIIGHPAGAAENCSLWWREDPTHLVSAGKVFYVSREGDSQGRSTQEEDLDFSYMRRQKTECFRCNNAAKAEEPG